MQGRWAFELDRPLLLPRTSLECGTRDGEGSDGGGLGAKDARAEGDMGPVVRGEEGDFVRGPPTFGADGESERSVRIPPFALRRMGHRNRFSR